jgi:hypothetical protein
MVGAGDGQAGTTRDQSRNVTGEHDPIAETLLGEDHDAYSFHQLAYRIGRL